MAFELTIAEGKGRGQRFSFELTDVTIGRGAENDVVLYDAGVSRMHARIQLQGTSWMLLDNGSSNGTELNGVVIQRAAPLRAGDRIGVGPVVFEFASAAEPRPLRAPGAASLSEETRITGSGRDGEPTRIAKTPSAEVRAISPREGGALQAPPRGGPLAWFEALPLWTRVAAFATAALLFVVAARAAVMGSKPEGARCPDVVAVDDEISGLSFGHGEVDVDCGEKASFGFTLDAAKARALFHYAPAHVGTPGELEVSLNGKRLGWAPVAASRGEAQTLSLPREWLSPDGRNVVTFRDAQRGKEWCVSRVRVETQAITPGDLKGGREAYERGRRKLEERRVAPRNLYDARKSFVAARQLLEGLSPHPALYAEVAQLIADCERELEKECSRLLFTAARQEKYGQDDRAQQTYREVLLHFPGEEPSGCRKKAQENVQSQPVEAQAE